MIIDHHVHLGFDLKTGFSLTAKDLLKKMDEYGIDRSIVFACPNLSLRKRNPYLQANAKILKVSKNSSRLIPFMFVHPFLDDVEKIKKLHGPFAGFKIYSSAQGMEYSYGDLTSSEQMKTILKTEKPILFHIGKYAGERPSDLIEIASQTSFPIILAHCGRLFGKDLKEISKLKNVYLDVTPLQTSLEHSFFLKDQKEIPKKIRDMDMEKILIYIEGLFGKERILWGTDTPWCDVLGSKGYGGEVEALKKLQSRGIKNSLF